MQTNKLIEAKKDELHYMDQVVKNLKYLEHLYLQGTLKNDKELFATQNAIEIWLFKSSRVEKFLNDNNVDMSFIYESMA